MRYLRGTVGKGLEQSIDRAGGFRGPLAVPAEYTVRIAPAGAERADSGGNAGELAAGTVVVVKDPRSTGNAAEIVEQVEMSLEIRDAINEVVAMIGPSGCGKSTFLRCLNRMNDTIEGCVGGVQLAGGTQFIVVSAIIVLFAVIASWRLIGVDQPEPSNAIAVLPFVNMSDDPDNE